MSQQIQVNEYEKLAEQANKEIDKAKSKTEDAKKFWIKRLAEQADREGVPKKEISTKVAKSLEHHVSHAYVCKILPKEYKMDTKKPRDSTVESNVLFECTSCHNKIKIERKQIVAWYRPKTKEKKEQATVQEPIQQAVA